MVDGAIDKVMRCSACFLRWLNASCGCVDLAPTRFRVLQLLVLRRPAPADGTAIPETERERQPQGYVDLRYV